MFMLDLSRAVWRKSSYSNGGGGGCVDTAFVDGGVAVRDSKNPDGPKLFFNPKEWKAFLAGVNDGEFDIP